MEEWIEPSHTGGYLLYVILRQMSHKVNPSGQNPHEGAEIEVIRTPEAVLERWIVQGCQRITSAGRPIN